MTRIPKKTLRGKRHIRARATVQVGRENRRFKKIMREIDTLTRVLAYLNSPEFTKSFTKAVEKMANAVRIAFGIIGKKMQEVAENIEAERAKNEQAETTSQS